MDSSVRSMHRLQSVTKRLDDEKRNSQEGDPRTSETHSQGEAHIELQDAARV